jgi:ABC-2 type transport system permease protein
VNVAVLWKTARDCRWVLLLVPVAILVFEVLVVKAVGEIGVEAAGFWLSRPLAKRIMTMLLGADVSASLTPTVFVTIGFVHPLLFALTWLLLLTLCTRGTVGEIDRGTADLLLTLPVSRARVYGSVSAVWILAGVPVNLATIGGIWVGTQVTELAEPIELTPLALLPVSLMALYVAVGGITMLFSSVVTRRGTAIAVVLAGLFASFLLNFMAPLWRPAGQVAFLGLLHYYRPLLYVRGAIDPWGDAAVLGTIGVIAWLVGLDRFCRRDIPVT